MPIDIRSASVSDAPAIRAVALESWHFTYAGIFTPDFIADFLDRNYSVGSLERAIAFTREDLFRIFDVAVDQTQRVVAFLQMSKNRDGEAVVWRVYVLPLQMRQGIGSRLLARLEAHLRAQAVSRYGLSVHSRNEIGKAFYLKHGFVHRPEKDEGDEWYMEKELLR